MSTKKTSSRRSKTSVAPLSAEHPETVIETAPEADFVSEPPATDLPGVPEYEDPSVFEDAPTQPRMPAPASRKVVVFYRYSRQDGSTGASRVFLEGVADLRTQSDIETVEALIRGQNQLITAEITGWRALEG